MMSAGVCFNGKGRLHFVEEAVTINAEYYVSSLLTELLEDAQSLVVNDVIFQQDGAPAHSSRRTQEWIRQRNPELIANDVGSSNSPDLNPLDSFICGVMLQHYEAVQPEPSSPAELRTVLQRIWNALPQNFIQNAVLSVRQRLLVCISQKGGHFQHL